MTERTKKSGNGSSTSSTTTGDTHMAQQNITFEMAYKQHLAEARALPAHEVETFTGNAELVLGNVQRGVGTVIGLDGDYLNAHLVRALGWKPEELRAAVVLAKAFSWANLLIDRDIASDGTAPALAKTVAVHRRKLMKTAEALVEADLLADAELQPIRPGHGPRDAAQDVTRLVAIFRKHAKKFAGKHPISEAELDQAEKDGADLWVRLNPEGAVQVKRLPQAVQADIEIRDRLWTLLLRRYEMAWKAGAMVWGWAVDEHVPALRARQAGKRAVVGGEVGEVPQPVAPVAVSHGAPDGK